MNCDRRRIQKMNKQHRQQAERVVVCPNRSCPQEWTKQVRIDKGPGSHDRRCLCDRPDYLRDLTSHLLLTYFSCPHLCAYLYVYLCHVCASVVSTVHTTLPSTYLHTNAVSRLPQGHTSLCACGVSSTPRVRTSSGVEATPTEDTGTGEDVLLQCARARRPQTVP